MTFTHFALIWVLLGLVLLIIGLSMFWQERRQGWQRVTPPPPLVEEERNAADYEALCASFAGLAQWRESQEQSDDDVAAIARAVGVLREPEPDKSLNNPAPLYDECDAPHCPNCRKQVAA